MPDTSVSYKCPNCGAPLSFLPGHDHVTCEYCSTELEIATVEALFEREQEKARLAAEARDSRWNTENAGGEWDEQDAATMKVQTCSSCGAELVSDGNTMATECAYCGSPNMLPQQFSGMLRPDFVIPFKKTKDEAIAALKKFYEKRYLLPDSFKSNNRIKEIQAMYVPFWLFDSAIMASASFRVERDNIYETADEIITETSVYDCERTGSMKFERIPVDGSERMDDTYMESIEPFDYSELVPFSAARRQARDGKRPRRPRKHRRRLRPLLARWRAVHHQRGRHRQLRYGARLDSHNEVRRQALHLHDERTDRQGHRLLAHRQAEGDALSPRRLTHQRADSLLHREIPFGNNMRRAAHET